MRLHGTGRDGESTHHRRGMDCREVHRQKSLGDDEWGFVPRRAPVQQELQQVVLCTVDQWLRYGVLRWILLTGL